jgi:phage terminase large subunit-like protein
MTEQQQQKQRAIDLLESRYRGMENVCEGIDMRLRMYFEDLLEHSSAREDDPHDWHGLYELLGGAKFLRCLDTYNFNTKKVQTVIRLREGEWRQDEGVWRHISGGLKCPGIAGGQVYRWANFQVFCLASIYGFYAWIDTQMPAGSKPQLLRTEREKDGTIWDYRRLCTDFTLTGSRKIDKTGFGGFIGMEFMLFEDYNMEGFCCANSEDQAKIIFRRIKYLLSGLDTENRFRLTESLAAWRDKYSEISTASIRPMTAGGKFKDGWFAQLCLKDEFGAAPYANGKSDMKMLVDVIESSMGPRREPLSVTMTSAGRITEGPFIQILDGLHGMLEREQSIAKGEVQPVLTDDRTMTLLLEPDAWQKEEQYLLTNKTVRHKVNPMLGVIVQHQFYDDQIAKAQRDGDTGEVIAKLFNVYSSGKVTKWITGDKIRPLQVAKRITDCHYQDGWRVFCGADFSHGDDLYAMVTLGVNYTPSDTMRGRFFADAVAWVLEETMKKSPNRPLYEEWVRQGWLFVSPGETFDSMLSINQLAAIDDRQDIDIRFFGYDPAQSIQPINQLKAWLQTILQKKNPQATAADIASVIQQMVVPVSQTALTQNPRIAELESMILDKEPWIEFSMSPLWPWCFGNCAAEVSSSDLRRIVKGGPQPTHKIDLVHALLDALYGFDLSENRVSE